MTPITSKAPSTAITDASPHRLQYPCVDTVQTTLPSGGLSLAKRPTCTVTVLVHAQRCLHQGSHIHSISLVPRPLSERGLGTRLTLHQHRTHCKMEWAGLGSARATTNMARAEGKHPATSLQSVLWIMGSDVLYPNLLPGRLPRAPVRVSRFHENVLASGRKKDGVKWGRWW